MENFLVRVKYKLKSFFSVLAIKAGLALNSPFLVAAALALASSSSDNKADYRVLVIGRSIFSDDIRAMFQFSGRIEYRTIHLEYWRLIFNHFNRGPERELLDEREYHISPYCQAGKKKYYEFLKKVFPYLKKRLSFQACLTGNILYAAQQEWSKVCEEGGVPFIVLHKEALVLPDVYQIFLNNYKKCKFFGSKILFYNRQCQEGFLSLKIEGLTPAKTALVGIPRLDFCFTGAQQKKEDENQVVFFSFIPRFSLRFSVKDEPTLARLDKRGEEFYKWVMEFAARHSDYKVIIKTKMAKQYFEYAQKIFVDNFKQNIENLTITNAADASQLVKDSAAVIGFNSTTLIEAIIADKKMVSPFFGDIVEQSWSFFEGHEAMVKYAKTYEELERYLLSEEVKTGYQDAAKRVFLEKYLFSATGDASQRAEKEIINIINSKK